MHMIFFPHARSKIKNNHVWAPASHMSTRPLLPISQQIPLSIGVPRKPLPHGTLTEEDHNVNLIVHL